LLLGVCWGEFSFYCDWVCWVVYQLIEIELKKYYYL